MPGKEVRNPATGFLYPTEGTTLTIPATAAKSIAVAAYDAIYDQLADFSGRGYTRATNQIKPDLAAPGVDHYRTCAGRRIYEKDRDIDGGAVCDRERGITDAVGDSVRK